MAPENTQRLMKSVFDKNVWGFIIDNMIVKRKTGLYYEVEKKVSIVREMNMIEKNYIFWARGNISFLTSM